MALTNFQDCQTMSLSSNFSSHPYSTATAILWFSIFLFLFWR